MPRFAAPYSAAIAARVLCTVARGMSSKTAASRASETGSPAANSKLSRIDFRCASSTQTPSESLSNRLLRWRFSGRRRRALQINRAEARFLESADLAATDQLEQRHEGGNHERTIARVFKQRRELNPGRAFERAHDARDALGDRDVAEHDSARCLVR